MPLAQFAKLLRSLPALGTRRALMSALTGAGVSAVVLHRSADAPVQAAKRKKRGHKKNRKQDAPKGCPKVRRCKDKCCAAGKTCKNGKCVTPATATPEPSETPDPTQTPEPTHTPEPTPTSTPEPEPRTWVRRSLHSLPVDGAVMTAFARGVEVMRNRNAGDPTGWEGQAAIHANSCQHGSMHFLAWHRMYVYWFERILRKASGDDSFALPYWDYAPASQRVLPAPFLTPSSSLYESARTASVNAGQGSSNDATFSTTDAMAATIFSSSSPSFAGGPNGGGYMESRPHNTVHTWVGGGGGHMGRLSTAALDPLFWVHHCNVDRLWEVWLRQGGDRANPTSGPFLSQVFEFYDEDGRPVRMRGSEILDTVDQLGYEYAGLGALGAQRQSSSLAAAASDTKFLGANTNGPLVLNPERTTVRIPLDAARPAAGQRLSVTFKGVTGTEILGTGYDVHVNPNAGKLTTRDASYVSTISFFGLRPSDRPGHGAHAVNIGFDITKAVGGNVPAAIRMVLVPVEYEPVQQSGPWGAIESIEISAYSVATMRQKPAKKRKRNPATRQPRGQQAAQQGGGGQSRPASNKRRQSNRKQRDSQQQKVKQRSSAAAAPHHAGTAPTSSDLGIIPGNKSSLSAEELSAVTTKPVHQH